MKLVLTKVMEYSDSFYCEKPLQEMERKVRKLLGFFGCRGYFWAKNKLKGIKRTDKGTLIEAGWYYASNRTSAHEAYALSTYEKGTRIDFALKYNSGDTAVFGYKSADKVFEQVKKKLGGIDLPAHERPNFAAKEDYSALSAKELVAKLNKVLDALEVSASPSTVGGLDAVAKALKTKSLTLEGSAKIAVTKGLGTINMYVGTLKTQLSTPGIDVSSFMGTYVGQMRTAVAEMEAAL